ncbi:hypothetical protein AJ87_27015 [Rhizobium yanglingense]|nr:hypothetical protein AJ87_27015 [Rhizobium yanglingense]
MVRKVISLVLGASLVVSGAYGFLYLLLFAVGPVKILYFTVPVGLFAVGIAILWEDVMEFFRRN